MVSPPSSSTVRTTAAETGQPCSAGRSTRTACFRYWNVIGTDCGRCLAVCPYSHPDNAAHNAMRWAIRRSGFGATGAFWLDDALYGHRPAPRPALAGTTAAD